MSNFSQISQMFQIFRVKHSVSLGLGCFLAAVLAPAVHAHNPNAAVPEVEKPGIVVAAFCSTEPAAMKEISDFMVQVRSAHPQVPAVLACTSATARERLQKNKIASLKAHDGISPLAALAYLDSQKVTDAYMLSMHLTLGQEYADLQAVAHSVAGLPKSLHEVDIIAPLLRDSQSAEIVAKILINTYGKDASAGRAVVFAGHGAERSGNLAYPALQFFLNKHAAGTPFFVVTLDDTLPIDTALPALKAGNYKEVIVAPLLLSAGMHAKREIFGKEADSISSEIRAVVGKTTLVHIEKGIISLPAVQKLWLERLNDALADAE